MKLAGKIALVTGGASGLGAACVRHFVEHDAQVVIADLDHERGGLLAQELGDSTHFIQTDVTNEQQVQTAVQTALDTFGELHILVNCAGIARGERTIGRGGPHTLALFEQIVKINLMGTFNATRLAANAMQPNDPNEHGERGVIISTASVAAYDGQIGQAAYAASKGGIVGMTLPIARDLARTGIRNMTIAPGIMDTPLLAALPETVRESLGQQVPFPARLGQPAEYAQLAHSIIENPYLNGEVIRLDGAIRMGPR